MLSDVMSLRSQLHAKTKLCMLRVCDVCVCMLRVCDIPLPPITN